MERTFRRVNMGCGPSPTPGWLNYDNSWSVRLARFPWAVAILERLGLLAESQLRLIRAAVSSGIVWSDATKHIPLPSNSVEVLYTSHMIEHLDTTEARLFLHEAYRVLALGGIIRIATPDLSKLVDHYNREADADSFMERSYLGRLRPKTLLGSLKHLMIGDRYHQWMYDGPSLCRLLAEVGFKEPRSLSPGSTIISDPLPLDLRERDADSVYVEARK